MGRSKEGEFEIAGIHLHDHVETRKEGREVKLAEKWYITAVCRSVYEGQFETSRVIEHAPLSPGGMSSEIVSSNT